MRDEYQHRTRISRFSNGYVAQCACGWVSPTEHIFEDDSSPEERCNGSYSRYFVKIKEKRQ